MNVFQTFLILMLSNGLACHVIVNPMLLDASGRDAWITALTAGIFFIGWSMMIWSIMKRSGQQHWREWLAEHTHPVLSWLLVAPVLLLLFLTAMETVAQTVSWHITNYLPASNSLQLGLLLLLICLFLAWSGLRAVAIASGVLLPIVIALGILVGASNSPIKDMTLLRPILEHGWGPVLQGMIYAGAAYSELIIIIMLQHHIRGSIKAWHMFSYSLFSVIIMCGPIIGAITEFGPLEAANQMTSPYEQWRLLRIGQYIEHLDFFSIFQWLSGASIRVTLAVIILSDNFPFRTMKQRKLFILALLVCFGIATLLPVNEYEIYVLMYRYYMPAVLAAILPLSLVWFGVAIAIKPGRRIQHEGQQSAGGPSQQSQRKSTNRADNRDNQDETNGRSAEASVAGNSGGSGEEASAQPGQTAGPTSSAGGTS
ncbi:spore gernimation protein [Paenibacillus herberti]|uniref:Spore gernimation protein n=2 Tax=Paenibacillus herberti TaxID=1619309 RepID=A0A229P5U3_9BACL|nr:spore gernimation protein [Paenibacillus herberti]